MLHSISSGGNYMISYDPFWETIRQKDISTYQLIYSHGILPDTIQRLRSGKTITTKTLNTLCSCPDIFKGIFPILLPLVYRQWIVEKGFIFLKFFSSFIDVLASMIL